jgi:CubicO group peptidase (beta-lactamase class C family)
VPGLSVAIGHAGSIVYKDVWGWADQESHEALTPQHLFRIASVSKPITSVTIFSLIEDDRLDLHDRVFGPRSILGKEFASPPPKPGSPSVDQITIEHLLTHTAGGWSNDSRDPMFMHPEMNHAQLIEWTLKERQLDHPPGQVFAYSNFGYCLLGRVIEKVTRRPYADYVRRPILSRCGIADMAIAGNTLADRRKGEVRHYGPGAYNMNVSRMDSHGGWLARPTDAVHFAMHVSGFVPPEQILRDETIRTMTTPTAASAKDNYAKGWAVNKAGNWWHTGILDGTNAVMVRTHSGFCWAAFINIGADIDDLDGLVWKMVGAVKAWKHA